MEFDPCLDDLTYGLDDDLDDVEVAIDRALDADLRRDIEDDFDYGGGSSGHCAVEEWEHPPVRGTKSKRRGRLRRWAARDDKRGTFTGKHTGVPNPVCPPEWDMTPDEYRCAVWLDNDEHLDRIAVTSMTAAAVGGAVMWPTVLLVPTGTLGDIAQGGLFFSMVAHVVGGVGATLCGADYLRWRRHDFSVLGERDPAQVISITDLPSEVCEVLLLLLDMNSSTAPPVSTVQRAERLHLGYRFAGVFTAAFEVWQASAKSPSALAFLHQHCRTELLELAKYASTVSDPWTTQAATRLTLQLGILERTTKQRIANADTARKAKAGFTAMRNPMDLNRHQTGQPGCMCRECMTSLPINSTAQFTADASAATAPAPVLSAQQRWDAAVATHERVIEAWTNIVTDPLAALDHTLLLDVTRPRTAAFIEAYGHAQDLAAIHGASMPEDAGEQRAYATAVRKADEAWTEAVRHARHVHLNWLPAEEEKRARQAKGLLSTAADEEVPMHVRAEAAKKAADLLAKVASFVLPPAATQALEANLRVLETRPAAAPGAEVLAPMLHTEPA